MDRINAITAFVRAVEGGGFSAAGRQLGVSPSAVGKAVARLEGRLGLRLLNRTTRKLGLTVEGAAYYERCRRILADLDDAEAAMAGFAGAPRGVLRAEVPVAFGRRHVVPALPDFLARCPEVEVELGLSDRFADLVEQGLDCAVRIGRLEDSSLVARRLVPAIRRLVVASPGYLARAGRPRTVEDLKGHNCLAIVIGGRPREWRLPGEGAGAGEVAVPVSGTVRMNDGEALRLAALAGLGLVLAPTYLVHEDLRDGTLEAVLPGLVALGPPVTALYPPNRHLSPKVRAFVDFLAARFAPVAYWDRTS